MMTPCSCPACSLRREILEDIAHDPYKAPEQQRAARAARVTGGCFGGACPPRDRGPGHPGPGGRPYTEEEARDLEKDYARSARTPAPSSLMDDARAYVEIVMPIMQSVLAWYTEEQHRNRAKRNEQRTANRRDNALDANGALAFQRLMLAGEALATAAELGATPEQLALRVDAYRDAADYVVADVDVPGEQIASEPTSRDGTPWDPDDAARHDPEGVVTPPPVPQPRLSAVPSGSGEAS